jgi:DMSO/TMAO reductase YedYZ molybdopterin-dependent catalytic subunit
MTAAQPEQLLVVSHSPFNAETPVSALRSPITPTNLHYVRSNFEVPDLGAGYQLLLDDGRGHNRPLHLEQVMALGDHWVRVTMDCAGNNRDGFSPLPAGEPWGCGAVSSAVWRGVPLHQVLSLFEVPLDTIEVLCVGADRGHRPGHDDPIPFARSLPLGKALHPDTMLAHEMNGEPLTSAHGAPLRLIVPGWYGMCSVKWVERIALLSQPFTGHFQRERYVMHRPGDAVATPLREIQVKSVVTDPRPGTELAAGAQLIGGAAWSGSAPIAAVDVRIDDGPWQPARLLGEPHPWLWRHWELAWTPSPGDHVIAVRARDTAGAVQPDHASWNALGYVNNAGPRVALTTKG